MGQFDFSVTGAQQKVCVSGSDDRFEIKELVGGEAVPYRVDGEPVFVGGSAGACVTIETSGDYRIDAGSGCGADEPVFTALDAAVAQGCGCAGEMAAALSESVKQTALLETIAAKPTPPDVEFVVNEAGDFYDQVATASDGTKTVTTTTIPVAVSAPTISKDVEPISACVDGVFVWTYKVFTDGNETGSTTVVTTEECGCCPVIREKKYYSCEGEVVVTQSLSVAKDGTLTLLRGLVDSSTMAAHGKGDVVADFDVAPWSNYGGSPISSPVNDELINGFVGVTQTVSVLGNDGNSSGATYVAGSVVGGTVVDNGDGTFELTPSDCAGEFKYVNDAGCEAAVSWDWTTRPDQTFSVGVTAATDFSFRFIETQDGSDVTVNLGDGTTTTLASNSALNHDYLAGPNAAAYTGEITVSYSGCTCILRISSIGNEITDVSGLSGLGCIEYLQLFDNKIVDISPLAGLDTLILLNLWRNEIVDVSPISALPVLETLHLAENDIVDVSPLSSLTTLTYLNLFANDIVDISPLASLVNLITLELYQNDIVDISPLATLINLTRLTLHQNELLSFAVISNFASLAYITMYNNPSITAAEVNDALCLLAAFMTSGTVNIAGSTAPPDNTSGGFNGLACKAVMTTTPNTVNVLTN